MRISGALVAGLLLVVGVALGAGTASADTAPSQPCSQALLPLLQGTQRQLCAAALGLTSTAGGTAGSAVQQVPQVVPTVPQRIPRVVTVVPRVPQVIPRASTTRAPASTSGTTGSGTSGTPGSSGPRGTASGGTAPRSVVVVPLPAGVPVAPTQNYDRLIASAPDRVPAGLLAPAAPSAGAPALLAPASFRPTLQPGLLAPARPARVLTPENGVTTTSTAGPAYYTAGERLGTPMLVGVLVLSSALALLVRASVLRRSRRTG